ncbi:helix-turn-helix transcriptional regulator [Paraburkholderia bryophila]|uniref:AlpA family transcriptional regulator n=1 Tax=Paraburkholderia bryophila TaxID=420952 RepID=A0A329BH34_9BURK|nr:AlpA family transcriptional regulator [Paraburkholderia bryophila]RAS21508.1 AlpA family transcriptional regulator [Paraburkholderia bryophila]
MQTHPTRIIRIATVLERTGLKKTCIYRLIKNGQFPSSIKLSHKCAGWVESEVNDWLNNRIASTRTQ